MFHCCSLIQTEKRIANATASQQKRLKVCVALANSQMSGQTKLQTLVVSICKLQGSIDSDMEQSSTSEIIQGTGKLIHPY